MGGNWDCEKGGGISRGARGAAGGAVKGAANGSEGGGMRDRGGWARLAGRWMGQ